MPAGGIRVLITDDEPQVRRALRRLLERDRLFTIIGEAGDGEEAARIARDHQPTAVILDLAMPGKDGLAAIPDIIKASPESKIVVLSSMAPYNDNAQKARELGAHAVLNKFTPPRKLLQAVADAVSEKE